MKMRIHRKQISTHNWSGNIIRGLQCDIYATYAQILLQKYLKIASMKSENLSLSWISSWRIKASINSNAI